MNNRTHEIKVRLSDDEFETLNDYVKRTGWPRERYIRALLIGCLPGSVPPLDYYNMIREIRKVGYNMRQIAQRAYAQEFIDAPLYEQNAKEVLDICDELTMICLPRK